MGGIVSMSDDMIHFTVTLEGLGEPHVVRAGIVSDLYRVAYEGGYIVDNLVSELTTRLVEELRKRLEEAVYG